MTTNQRKLAVSAGWLGCSVVIIYREIRDGGEQVLSRIIGGLILPTIGFTIYYLVWEKIAKSKQKMNTVGNFDESSKQTSASDVKQNPILVLVTIAGALLCFVGSFVFFKKVSQKVDADPVKFDNSQTPAFLDDNKKEQGSIEKTPAVEIVGDEADRSKFTTEQKRARLVQLGYNPDEYGYESDVGKAPPSAFDPQKAGANYYILVDSKHRYWSKKEPKPFGSGFKFISIASGKEMIVSGNVNIRKLSDE